MEPSKRSMSRDERIVAQKDDLQDLKGRQIEAANSGEQLATIEANRNPKYSVREIEAKGFVHVRAVVRHLNFDQKSFNDEEHIVKVHAREFDRRVSEGAFKTYDEVEVIHDPRVNAPSSYSLKPEFAKVDNKPIDLNVETKVGTTKIPAAGKPGSVKAKPDADPVILTPAKDQAPDLGDQNKQDQNNQGPTA